MKIEIAVIILIVILGIQTSRAETKVDVNADFAFGPDISRNEACSRAEEKAKKNALINVVGEKITNNQFESCVDTETDLNCTIFEDTFSFLGRGAVTGMDNYSSEISEELGQSICSVRFTATVAKISQKSDPAYTIDVEILPNTFLRNGEPLEVRVKTSKPSYIYLYGWFPEVDKDTYFLISEPATFHEKLINDEVMFPGKAYIPDNINKKSISEYLVVLASKHSMVYSSKMSRSKFFKIINSTPRDNWVMDTVVYRIIRNKS